MSVKILKFGGSSIASADRIRHVADIIKNVTKKRKIGVVVSALGGVTDLLIELAHSAVQKESWGNMFQLIEDKHSNCMDILLPKDKVIRNDIDEYLKELNLDLSSLSGQKQISEKSLDKILSFGERCSSAILAQYLTQIGLPSEQLDARKVIVTDDHYGNAFVHYQRSFSRIRNYYQGRERTQIITGFIGATETGETTTLGRSGSDYTAAIFGAALNASAIEIWTDVSGILSANPNLVSDSETVARLTYEEAMELAHAGAKVIFPPTMIPALFKSIPIRIKNTFEPSHPGSLITKDRKKRGEVAVGISSVSDVALVRLQGAGMVGMKGLIARIFTSLAQENINIILVSQAFSEHSICFAINPDRVQKAEKTLENEFSEELKQHNIDNIKVEKHLSLVAVVGEGMRHTPGISGRVFNTLGQNGINVVAIAQGSSERNISFIVDDKNIHCALNALHKEFFKSRVNTTDVYLAGVGTIGSELLSIIQTLQSSSIRVRAVASSNKMLLGSALPSCETFKEELMNSGEIYHPETFLSFDVENPNPKIFVDCTASESLAKNYLNIFEKGFSIVTANKIANTLDQSYYAGLRKTAAEKGVKFKYETNVGAGLPVIRTLRNLINTGDEIIRIDGILSGTLSYLFSKFDGTIPFSKLVEKAREKGYTEPDPREDLNGMDVARKILILARETGAILELENITVDSLLPNGIDPTLTVDEFLKVLVSSDGRIKTKYLTEKSKGNVLRYIGSWDGKNASVGLRAVGPNHPFYGQNGRENFIMIQSKRYNEIPLVIKGHGAGASVTAAGILSDIQSCTKNKK